MTDNSWYARALDRARGVAPTQRAAPPQRPQVYVQPQAFAPQQHAYYPQAPTQPQAYSTDVKFQQADLTTLLKLQEQGRGQPGQGSKSNPDPCPGCGGALFIETMPGGRKRRGPEPAPHCFTCGYNGLFDQGLESSWASGPQP